jgi:hypothetical protein
MLELEEEEANERKGGGVGEEGDMMPQATVRLPTPVLKEAYFRYADLVE